MSTWTGTNTGSTQCQRCGETISLGRYLCDICRQVPERTAPPVGYAPAPSWNIPFEYLRQEDAIRKLREACVAARELLNADCVEHHGVITQLNRALKASEER